MNVVIIVAGALALSAYVKWAVRPVLVAFEIGRVFERIRKGRSRPPLRVVGPGEGPDFRHGLCWRWFRVREVWGTARWRILTAVAVVVAVVVPRVRAQAWAEGFTVGLGGEGRTRRQYLGGWRAGNELGAAIQYGNRDRSHVADRLRAAQTEGELLDAARRGTVFAVPPAAARAAMAAALDAGQSEWAWHAWRTVVARWLRRPSAGGAHEALRAVA